MPAIHMNGAEGSWFTITVHIALENSGQHNCAQYWQRKFLRCKRFQLIAITCREATKSRGISLDVIKTLLYPLNIACQEISFCGVTASPRGASSSNQRNI